MAKTYVFDIETDNLLPSVTKIHCLTYQHVDGGNIVSLTDYGDIMEFILEADCLIGHNIVGYDLPVIKKLLGITFRGKTIDTYPLAATMMPGRSSYGLAGFGKDYKIPKPQIDDWENLTTQDYIHRCEEDVKINAALFNDLMAKLNVIYYQDVHNRDRYLDYLDKKARMAAKQEELRWDVDIEAAEALKAKLEPMVEEKVEELADAMPLKCIMAVKNKPKIMTRADGSCSALGAAWYDFLHEHGLPGNTEGPVEYVKERVRANPGSVDQIKSWLGYLGWEPKTYKYVKNKVTGESRAVPQVRTLDTKELCESVLELKGRSPAIGALEGLTVLKHRLTVIDGLLNAHSENGYVHAGVHGLTNTLRFKHVAPLVNLPGIDKPYGKEIRGLLIAGEGNYLCGSDMVSLESTTKRHYMYPHDPDYCDLMSEPDFDEHLDLAKFAGALTQADIDSGDAKVKAIRKNYKAVNYASQYGVGKETLSRQTGLSQTESAQLISSYWERNWAVKKVVEEIKLRNYKDEMWAFNPVSRFWYNIRAEKDIWSTINQSTGVFCFDTWIDNLNRRELYPIGQFHDEVILRISDQLDKKEIEYDLRQAMVDTNDQLKLNVMLDIDVQFGNNYSDIH